MTRVDRADTGTDDYGDDAGCTKLFFDTQAKRSVKQIAFERSRDVTFANDIEAQRLLSVSAADVRLLRERRVFAAESST